MSKLDREATLVDEVDRDLDETTRWALALEETLIIPIPCDTPIQYADTELVNPELNDMPTLEWIDLDMLYLLARAARAARNRSNSR